MYRFGKERKRAPPHHIDRSRLLNMAPGMAFAIGLILVVGQLKEGPGTLAKTFTFPEYPYKETTKNVSRPNQFGENPREGRVSILCTGYGRCLVFWGVALFAAPASSGNCIKFSIGREPTVITIEILEKNFLLFVSFLLFLYFIYILYV